MDRIAFPVVLMLAWVAAAPVAAQPVRDRDELFDFAVEMARKGNWREARYRWQQALALAPLDASIANNLGVASEALGDPGAAEAFYAEALQRRSDDAAAITNRERLRSFLARSSRSPAGGETLAGDPPAEAKKAKKTLEVQIRLPVPARLDLTAIRSVLVAGFSVAESDLLDVGKEIVRHLRGELRKKTKLDVLDVNPPPAVPEQGLEDLAANAGFWRQLGREYGADLIVSGVARFTRRDASGFQDVDTVSGVTGQKVRDTRFVEQEQFEYDAVVLFVDGARGEVIARDRLRRGAVFNGLANDPITAFYDLLESTAGDFLASVASSTRSEPRLLYKK
jgi:hypothetical protein